MQFGRPFVDIVNDNWQEDDGDTVDLFDQIDETIASDADFIRTQLTPTNDVYVAKLTAIVDPQSSNAHTVRYRYGKDVASGDSIDITVELRQGYISEASMGVLIASASHPNVAPGFVDGSIALTGVQADSISDYADLYLRFVGNRP